MYYEHINTSFALPCNHDSGSDTTLAINNTLVNSSKISYSPMDNHGLNRGFVNTDYDDHQNVSSYNEFEQIARPCYVVIDTVPKNSKNFDNFSGSNNDAPTWVRDGNNYLTGSLERHWSPAWNPLGHTAHESMQWGCKHEVDIFTATDEYVTDTLALIFIHASVQDDLWGWYYLSTGAGENSLFKCNSVSQGFLQVSHSMDMYFEFASNLQFSPKMHTKTS